jgi:cysteine-rich repeat protein
LAVLLLLPTAVFAQVGPVGSEFQVNSYTVGGQFYFSAAGAVDGAFVVAWSSGQNDGDVFGRRYDSAGQPVGGDFQINSHTMGYQVDPVPAFAGDGSFMVAWLSDGQDGDSFGVFGQRFDSAGQMVGTAFQVNSYTVGAQGNFSQGKPAVAAAADGSFVIAWISGEQDGDGDGVFAQRFDSAGQQAGSEFQVNSHTMNTQYEPAVAAGADGAFVVAWTDIDDRDGSSFATFAQRYDSSGAPAGTEFQVNSYTIGGQYSPTVDAAVDGSFVVAWNSEEQDGEGGSVFAQRFNSVGQRVGAEFQVNSYTPGDQTYPPALASAPDGSFVVAWRDRDKDGDSSGIFGQYFASTGQRLGSEFQANTYTLGEQLWPAVTAAMGGAFVVVWQDGGLDGDSYGIFAQRFASQGVCGNNVVDPGEECDDGGTVDADNGCDSNCTITACGNGILTNPEECDDGNTNDGDGCSATCQDSAAPENATSPAFTVGSSFGTDTENDGATEADPVETSIGLNAGTAGVNVGTISATIAEASDLADPVPGYSFFGQQVQIDIDCPVGPCPSPSYPLTIDFRIDASRVPAGVDENTFAIFRDGVLVPPCTGAPGVADPDPCVAARELFNDGDIGATILTSQASVWGFGAGVCAAAPVACANPGKSVFQVKRAAGDPDSTKLLWKWLKGTVGSPSDFADPVAGGSVTLCIYDDGSLVQSHVVAPGGDCGGKPCWKTVGTKGFKYKNKSGNDDGITKVLLKSGMGKAKLLVKGKGANVRAPQTDPMDPIYTQSSQLTVQLVVSGGACWQAVFPNPASSTATQFKDKIP